MKLAITRSLFQSPGFQPYANNLARGVIQFQIDRDEITHNNDLSFAEKQQAVRKLTPTLRRKSMHPLDYAGSVIRTLVIGGPGYVVNRAGAVNPEMEPIISVPLYFFGALAMATSGGLLLKDTKQMILGTRLMTNLRVTASTEGLIQLLLNEEADFKQTLDALIHADRFTKHDTIARLKYEIMHGNKKTQVTVSHALSRLNFDAAIKLLCDTEDPQTRQNIAEGIVGNIRGHRDGALSYYLTEEIIAFLRINCPPHMRTQFEEIIMIHSYINGKANLPSSLDKWRALGSNKFAQDYCEKILADTLTYPDRARRAFSFMLAIDPEHTLNFVRQLFKKYDSYPNFKMIEIGGEKITRTDYCYNRLHTLLLDTIAERGPIDLSQIPAPKESLELSPNLAETALNNGMSINTATLVREPDEIDTAALERGGLEAVFGFKEMTLNEKAVPLLLEYVYTSNNTGYRIDALLALYNYFINLSPAAKSALRDNKNIIDFFHLISSDRNRSIALITLNCYYVIDPQAASLMTLDRIHEAVDDADHEAVFKLCMYFAVEDDFSGEELATFRKTRFDYFLLALSTNEAAPFMQTVCLRLSMSKILAEIICEFLIDRIATAYLEPNKPGNNSEEWLDAAISTLAAISNAHLELAIGSLLEVLSMATQMTGSESLRQSLKFHTPRFIYTQSALLVLVAYLDEDKHARLINRTAQSLSHLFGNPIIPARIRVSALKATGILDLKGITWAVAELLDNRSVAPDEGQNEIDLIRETARKTHDKLTAKESIH